jgi:hypothetical protein
MQSQEFDAGLAGQGVLSLSIQGPHVLQGGRRRHSRDEAQLTVSGRRTLCYHVCSPFALPELDSPGCARAWSRSSASRGFIRSVSVRSRNLLVGLTEDCPDGDGFDHEVRHAVVPGKRNHWAIEHGKVVVTGYRRCLERLNLGVSPLAIATR